MLVYVELVELVNHLASPRAGRMLVYVRKHRVVVVDTKVYCVRLLLEKKQIHHCQLFLYTAWLS